MECKECNKAIGENDIFCPSCGVIIKRLCHNCGNLIANGDLFCRKCGCALLKLEIFSKMLPLGIAKSLAHRLNNALSIILTSSQLALHHIEDLNEKTANELRKLLNDIAISADSSGILIHQFQRYIDLIEQMLPQNEMEVFADQTENYHQRNFTAELQTPDINKNGIKLIKNISSVKKQASILIVDDEDKIRYAMSYGITLGGHNVITAQNGQEALKLINNRYYDIAFIDLILPDMDGWEVIKSIRQISPNTMIFLMTGWNVRLDDEKLKEANLDTVLTKPFQLSDVNDLIKSALENNKE